MQAIGNNRQKLQVRIYPLDSESEVVTTKTL